jgi:hypothetical protein
MVKFKLKKYRFLGNTIKDFIFIPPHRLIADSVISSIKHLVLNSVRYSTGHTIVNLSNNNLKKYLREK